jgi:hypothetical protein
MADIFISYSTADRATAAKMADFLQEEGYSVWWDRELSAGQQFAGEIAQALADCRAAIVIWTPSSIKSRWVLGEAEAAASTEKLIPVREDSLSESQLPIGFRALHTIALSDRAGLVRAVQARDTPRKAASRWDIIKMRLARHLLAARRWLTPRNAAMVAVLAVFGAYVAVMMIKWNSIKDSMEPSDFEQYLASFRYGPYAQKARAKLAGMDEWKKVKGSRTTADLQEFTEKFQSSMYYQYARLRLTRLQAIASQKYKLSLPDASHRALTPEEIDKLDCTGLWTGRNEIFYSLGYCFVSDQGIDFFGTGAECPSDCKLTLELNALTQDIISKVENDNINMMQSREQKIGCLRPAVRCARRQ